MGSPGNPHYVLNNTFGAIELGWLRRVGGVGRVGDIQYVHVGAGEVLVGGVGPVSDRSNCVSVFSAEGCKGGHGRHLGGQIYKDFELATVACRIGEPLVGYMMRSDVRDRLLRGQALSPGRLRCKRVHKHRS